LQAFEIHCDGQKGQISASGLQCQRVGESIQQILTGKLILALQAFDP
jgi:hypothetical protein